MTDPRILSDKTAILLAIAVVAALALLTQTGTSPCNDASRLATAESLANHGTFAIGDSYFAYTCDFVKIDGLRYSDKPPVFSVALAGLYAAVTAVTGWTAETDLFSLYYVLALLTSGLSLLATALGVRRIALVLGSDPRWAALVGGAASLGTLALTYATTVSSHVVGAAFLVWGGLGILEQAKSSRGRLVGTGVLFGFAVVIDPLAISIVLPLTALALWRDWRRGLWIVAGGVPLAAIHSGLTYAIAGHPIALNLNPEHFDYAGSIHNERTLSGVGWKHDTLSGFATYAWDSLLGFRGFAPYNLPAAAGLFGLVALASRQRDGWAIAVLTGLLIFFFLTLGFSLNYSGNGYGIRWHALIAPLATAGLAVPSDEERLARLRRIVIAITLIVGATVAAIGTINPLSVWSGPDKTHSLVKVLDSPEQNVTYLMQQAKPLFEHERFAQAIYFAELARSYVEPVPDLWYILVHSAIELDDRERLRDYRARLAALDMKHRDQLIDAIDKHLESAPR